jgi:hypothetical protein
MSSQLTTIICVIFGVISWYYFNKFQESEREYSRLHKNFGTLHVENQKMRTRIKDLQSYKNDVSKTFKILDNELIMINDHLKRRNEPLVQQSPNRFTLPVGSNSQTSIPVQATIRTSTVPLANVPLSRISSFTNIPAGNNVSLLTPELLTSLFNMNTEDLSSLPQPAPQQAPQPAPQQAPQPAPQPAPQQAPQMTSQMDTQSEHLDTQLNQQRDQVYRENTNDEYSGLEMNLSTQEPTYDISDNSNRYDQFLINN